MTLRKFLCAGLLLATGGALLAEDEPNANGAAKRVVILGDSITAGYGLDPQEAYPALLQKKIDAAKLPYSVTNAGVSGDTTAGGLRRVAWALGKGADVIVVALGGNDGLRGISPEETRANLTGIVDKAREKNPAIKIVIAGMQMPDNLGADYTTKFKALFSEVAKERKAALVPFLLKGVGGDGKLNQADGIHPTAEGQRIVAENVWQILQPVIKGG
ncbi:arylesterase [Luteolibacter marinus]|uniref:arylesterase n=1 Tax=Luteolibacter marinus TaxID=2776705 RepID=UPI0018674DB9|nr:arylesterase [Luteolibacter marinus]